MSLRWTVIIAPQAPPVRKIAEVWSVGGLKTVMAAACHEELMSIRIWLLHDLVVHELFELLLSEAMHQLARLVRRLKVLAVLAHFVDVYLHSCQPSLIDCAQSLA
jgi:hypothetical protein